VVDVDQAVILQLICAFVSLQVYHDGIRNINTLVILRKLALPVVLTLILALTVPYVLAAGIMPIFGKYNCKVII
jgi:hypothetical protein